MENVDEKLADQLHQNLKGLNEGLDKSIDFAFKSFESQFSEEGAKKWRKLAGRLGKAMASNNIEAVTAIKEDLNVLIEEEEKIEK